MKERNFKMIETLRVVKEYELAFDIEYAVEEMLKALDADLDVSTNGQYGCVDDLPPETKEHLRDEILKGVLKRFEIF
jgi:hypothetical protein